jgi:hypothetical protein
MRTFAKRASAAASNGCILPPSRAAFYFGAPSILIIENSSTTGAPQRAGKAAWSDTLARYRRSSAKRALWQLATTLIPYLLLWYLISRARS